MIAVGAPAAEEAAGVVTPEMLSSLELSPETSKLVVALGLEGARLAAYAFEKIDGAWFERLRADGYSGRNGINRTKAEGDGRTPSGVFSFGRAFGVADDPGSRKPYAKLSPGDLWVDDPESKYYNQWVREDAPDKDWKSAEDLSKETVAYKYAIAIDYNAAPVVKGAGSAIFLHCAQERPTAGCVAVPEDAMVDLLKFIDDGALIVIASSPTELASF
jgi:L,D-peptidoglycan transpeptidase YkuD (ErfK/YbiS/YcfS/YnhG family)